MLVISSGGGHWVELLRVRAAFADYDTLYATTLRGVKAPSGHRKVKVVCDASRSNVFMIIISLIQIMYLLLKFRPGTVITTGAAPGLIAIRLGKTLGATTIWIDSMANCDEISLSGRLAKHYSDLWLTQWPHLLKSDSKLQYFGAVL